MMMMMTRKRRTLDQTTAKKTKKTTAAVGRKVDFIKRLCGCGFFTFMTSFVAWFMVF